jgi:hypothetical protein
LTLIRKRATHQAYRDSFSAFETFSPPRAVTNVHIVLDSVVDLARRASANARFDFSMTVLPEMRSIRSHEAALASSRTRLRRRAAPTSRIAVATRYRATSLLLAVMARARTSALNYGQRPRRT